MNRHGTLNANTKIYVAGHCGMVGSALVRALERPEDWSRPKTVERAETPESRFEQVDRLCAEIGAVEMHVRWFFQA